MMTGHALRYGRRRPRRGATAVEFAVVAPLFFLLLLGLFEFGHLMLLRNTVENAAYEGCRQGIVPGATADEARDIAESILRSSGARSFTVSVTPAVIDDDTEQITVSVTLPFSANAWLLPRFGFSTSLDASVELTAERE